MVVGRLFFLGGVNQCCIEVGGGSKHWCILGKGKCWWDLRGGKGPFCTPLPTPMEQALPTVGLYGRVNSLLKNGVSTSFSKNGLHTHIRAISGTSIHELVGWVQIYIILQNTDSCEQVYRHVVVSLNGNNLRQILGHVAMWKDSLPQTLFQLNVFCWNELGSSHMAHVASVAMPHEVVSIWRLEKTAVLVPKIWKAYASLTAQLWRARK